MSNGTQVADYRRAATDKRYGHDRKPFRLLYAYATGVKGFYNTYGDPVDEVFCKVTRRVGDCVWVRTCDLNDTNTPLVLDASQVELVDDREADAVFRHREGLTCFG